MIRLVWATLCVLAFAGRLRLMTLDNGLGLCTLTAACGIVLVASFCVGPRAYKRHGVGTGSFVLMTLGCLMLPVALWLPHLDRRLAWLQRWLVLSIVAWLLVDSMRPLVPVVKRLWAASLRPPDTNT